MPKAKRTQASQLRWVRDSTKELYWRNKIAEWKSSGLSIRAFCSKFDVIETSFYAWRRELAMRDREADASNAHPENDVALPEKVRDSRGRLIPVKFREHQHASAVASPASAAATSNASFVQLVVESDSKLSEPRPALELVCPNGFVIRVACDADLEFLSRIVKIME